MKRELLDAVNALAERIDQVAEAKAQLASRSWDTHLIEPAQRQLITNYALKILDELQDELIKQLEAL